MVVTTVGLSSPVYSQSQTGAAAENSDGDDPAYDESGIVADRIRREREAGFDPRVIVAHKHNYFMPLSFTSQINNAAYQLDDVPLRDGLRREEVKFQMSLKAQLNAEDLFFSNDGLYFGITLAAWWQLYSDDLSSPFRETNYQPEMFYINPLGQSFFGANTSVGFGMEHQSNGQVQGLSRSWNRLYANFILDYGGMVMNFRPWYRIPEKAKEDPTAAEGDDNPDIHLFMGYGDLTIGWQAGDFEMETQMHGNPKSGKGGIRFGVTYPLFAKFRGYIEYFNGYGESLIDYNHYQHRVGVGVALTDLL
ncbi:MAG: phospholipase A [Pseudomonadales bacterium]